MFIELSLSTVKMADLEAVLADVSYLMAMEKSKSTPAARASKKIILPDPRYVPNTVTSQDVLYVAVSNSHYRTCISCVLCFYFDSV